MLGASRTGRPACVLGSSNVVHKHGSLDEEKETVWLYGLYCAGRFADAPSMGPVVEGLGGLRAQERLCGNGRRDRCSALVQGSCADVRIQGSHDA